MGSYAVLINSCARKGRIRELWPGWRKSLEAAWGSPAEELWTRENGHAMELAREAVRSRRTEILLVVGGDGTVHEVVNGVISSGLRGNDLPVLAVLPAGTGNDWVRQMGFSREWEATVSELPRARPRPVDIGLVSYFDEEGRPGSRYFFNVTDAGAGGAVIQSYQRHRRRGVQAGYFRTIAEGLWSYKNQPIAIRCDDGPWETAVRNNVIIGNGWSYGGGIRAVPQAVCDDGWLDGVWVGDIKLPAVLWNFGSFRRGKMLSHPKVATARFRKVELAVPGKEPVYLEADGELLGKLPATITIQPGALRFLSLGS